MLNGTCLIPPIYSPGLSEDVIACAERIAAGLLSEHDFGSDWTILYRVVRTAMGRVAVCDIERPTLDDESISQGIVQAINAA